MNKSSTLERALLELSGLTTIRPGDTNKAFVKAALSLMEQNVKQFYDCSTSMPWSDADKEAELLCRHQIAIYTTKNGQSALEAFASVSVEVEDLEDAESSPVLYLYELQVDKVSQGQGLGTRLLHAVAELAKELQLSKVMLTTFVDNEKACRFYRRHGFGEHWSSPEPEPGGYLIFELPLHHKARP